MNYTLVILHFVIFILTTSALYVHNKTNDDMPQSLFNLIKTLFNISMFFSLTHGILFVLESYMPILVRYEDLSVLLDIFPVSLGTCRCIFNT